MNKVPFQLKDVKILRTGVDGGHLYLFGKCDHDEDSDIDTYAYFADKTAEKSFEQSWQGQDLLVTSPKWEMNPGEGLHLNDIKWKIIGH